MEDGMGANRVAAPLIFLVVVLVVGAAVVLFAIGAVRRSSRNLAMAAEHERSASFYGQRALDLLKSDPEASKLMGLRFKHHKDLQNEYERAAWKPWTEVRERAEPAAKMAAN
jgi:hypothetical protein